MSTGNTFNNSGEQNVAQGNRPIGQQNNVTQPITGNGNIFSGTGDINIDRLEQHYHDAPAPVIPRLSPTTEPCFLHREEELAWLNERLQAGAVVAVCGPGGMGKSALAAQTVSKLEEGRFPDGVVFHSFYHKPSTDMALQTIAGAFQVEAKAGLESAVRQALAGKQALLILDGAEEADDLPAVLRLRGGCGVLITSRKTEDAPDALWELKPLEEKPAEEVFLRYSGPVSDAASAAAICNILDGWPVGLRIAGRYLRSTKESAADYLRWLDKKPFRKLGAGKHQEDNAALLLGRSVEQVSADAVQVLRLAGVLAFASISLGPVMAVVGKEDEDQDEVELRSTEALNELVNYGLMEKPGERWQTSHALVHTYARTELALSKESLERLAGWYIDFCRTQSQAGLEGYTRLDAERAHCLRLMESCLESKLWQEVQGLVRAINTYLDRQGYWTEWQTAVSINLTAARLAGDRKEEGWGLNEIGRTCNRRGDYTQALAYYEQSLPIRQEVGDKFGEGRTLNNIGTIYRQQGKHEQALERYEQSLTTKREIGDREGEGRTLNNIGFLYRIQGDNKTALAYYQQCLPIKREVGDKRGEGITLNNIAKIYRMQGNAAKALEYYEQALAICQQFGDRAGEAVRYWNLGLTYEDLGDLAQAEEYMSQAVQIEEAIGHPDLENDRKTLARVRAARQA